jgi:hypothetical protein
LIGINAPSSCKCLSLKFSNYKKEACGYVKRKVLKKWTSVWDIINNGYSNAHHEKKREEEKKKEEMKKIAYAL